MPTIVYTPETPVKRFSGPFFAPKALRDPCYNHLVIHHDATRNTFAPPRRFGLLFQSGIAILLIAGGGLAVFQALQTPFGPVFILYITMLLLSGALLPVVAYRMYALARSSYGVEREGLRLQWGLRVEDIPMPDVMEVAPAEELDHPLPIPPWTWPGALVGVREAPGIGEVEFMASDSNRILVVHTPDKLYAISPEDPNAFLQDYRAKTELGSLDPLPARSVLPRLLLLWVWTDLPARTLLLAGLAVTLGVLVWVGLNVATQSTIPLGFTPQGDPRQPVPAIRLSLLPIINSFFFTVDLMLGMFFYQRTRTRPLAYVLWIAGIITSTLFLGAMYYIIQFQ